MISRKTIGEAFRFCVTGGLATLLHYGVYYLLQNYINENVAFTIGYFVSFVMNYILSAKFTFKENTSAKNGIGFLGAHCFNYLLQISLLNVFLCMGVMKQYAPIPVYCIAVPVNFFVVRLVFRSKFFKKNEIK